ncbi:hypothetical protein [Parvibium lacunae]|uniref:Uncharacterized protein n=1 Tax=Parvibium lacunae TaxID=1888893 RepID=A0A368L215_9BURK|nr:hypothetical protein [Parvibium lacunae]RCS57491.1 hypothetical protein DU000_08565 [Parvibium lacunae]
MQALYLLILYKEGGGMVFRLLRFLSLFFAWITAISAYAQDSIYIQSPARFSTDSVTRDALRQECDIERELGEKTLVFTRQRMTNVESVIDPDPLKHKKMVTLLIPVAVGSGGGGWTGNKILNATAEYWFDGQIVATESFIDSSRGGVLGGFRGTCSIVENIAAKLAKRIALWIKQTDQSIGPNGELLVEGKTTRPPITLIRPIQLALGAEVNQSIVAECALPQTTEAYFLDMARRLKQPILLTNESNIKDGLKLTLVGASGLGGTAFTGEKNVSLRFEVLVNDVIKQTQDFEMSTIGAIIGPAFWDTTCPALIRLARKATLTGLKWLIKSREVENPLQTPSAVNSTAAETTLRERPN